MICELVLEDCFSTVLLISKGFADKFIQVDFLYWLIQQTMLQWPADEKATDLSATGFLLLKDQLPMQPGKFRSDQLQ